MLILASVSINAIVGDNGIITIFQNAKIATEEAALWETIQEILVETYENEFETIVDFFDANGELIESIDNLPNIIYNNKEIEISENTSELKNGSYYLIRYFDNSSIYAPYFIVYLSNNNFKVGDVWVVSSNESYYNFDAELQY